MVRAEQGQHPGDPCGLAPELPFAARLPKESRPHVPVAKAIDRPCARAHTFQQGRVSRRPRIERPVAALLFVHGFEDGLGDFTGRLIAAYLCQRLAVAHTLAAALTCARRWVSATPLRSTSQRGFSWGWRSERRKTLKTSGRLIVVSTRKQWPSLS